VKKLGIKPGSALALVNAPRGFRGELVGLPGDVRVLTRVGGAPDFVIWFVVSCRDLDARIARMAGEMGAGLWIAWPKRASGVVTELTEDVARGARLARGLVNDKVCDQRDVVRPAMRAAGDTARRNTKRSPSR
jgi:hypothetical protein